MPRLFDAYIMVDWSAAAKPVTGANSIWIGILARDARLKFQFKAVNPDTRLKARSFIEDMVGRLTGRGDKVLLGFDFSLGYPAGTAQAAGFDCRADRPGRPCIPILPVRCASVRTIRMLASPSLRGSTMRCRRGHFPSGARRSATRSPRSVAGNRIFPSMRRWPSFARPRPACARPGEGSPNRSGNSPMPEVSAVSPCSAFRMCRPCAPACRMRASGLSNRSS